MDNLEPITRNEMFLNGDDLEPITREEMILAGADLEPITRHEWFLKKYRGGGGGGGYDLVNVPNLPADIASFNDGTDLPMASLKVAVTPYQDLSHGDPSPDNICPIIGWDEAVVTVADDAENPTTSHEYTIDLDGTRYGGKVDLVSGVMTVTHKFEVFKGNISEGWFDSSSGDILRFATIRKDMKESSVRLPLLNNIAKFSTGNENNICFGVTLGGNNIIYYYADSSVTNLSELYTWLSNNNMQVVYPLETPITIQLTPTVVKSLEGKNNISADCGDIIELEYFSKEV